MEEKKKTKVCAKCRRSLPIEDFTVCMSGKDNRSARCRECMKEYTLIRRHRFKKMLQTTKN